MNVHCSIISLACVQSHKSAFPRSDRIKPGPADGSLVGSLPVIIRASDVLVMSECTEHSGLPKTSDGLRSNLYYNYTMKGMSVMAGAPAHGHNYVWPEAVRARLSTRAQALTEWMQWARWDH